MFIYQMENELVVKQLYHNVDIYSHDFKAELFECKTTFMVIILICFCRQGESHCFYFDEICTNFALLRRSDQILDEGPIKSNTKKNTEKIIFQHFARFKKQALAEREIPDDLASPAPTSPPVPKVAARL